MSHEVEFKVRRGEGEWGRGIDMILHISGILKGCVNV